MFRQRIFEFLKDLFGPELDEEDEENKRLMRQKIGQKIFWTGEYLMISVEEFILLSHLDRHNRNKVKGMDVFVIRNLFAQLNPAYKSMDAFEKALKRLEDQGMIRLGSACDGQMTFQTSEISHPGRFDEFLRRVRAAHDIGEMLEIGRLDSNTAAFYIPRA